MIPRILVLAGSTRSGSFNVRLAGEATRLLAMTDVALTTASLADYPLPLFDADADAGVPQNAKLLAQRIALQDGLLIVSPEYNAGIAPLLKNAIDWASQVAAHGERPVQPFRRLVVGLASASTLDGGGRFGLMQVRAVLLSLGAEVLTAECHVPRAGEAFDPQGRLADPATRLRLEELVDALLDHSRALGRQV